LLAAKGLAKLKAYYVANGAQGIAHWRMLQLEENDIRNGFAIRELDTPLNEARATLLPRERQAYIDAVNCLMSKPSRVAATDTSIAPGATIR
jgi:hypothetical protein